MADERDPDGEVQALRAWMAEHELMPPIHPDLMPGPERVGTIVASITSTPRPGRTKVHRPAFLTAAAVLVLVIALVSRGLLWPEPVRAQGTPRMLTYSMDELANLDDAPSAKTDLETAAGDVSRQVPADQEGDVQYVETYGWLLAVDNTESTISPTVTQHWLMPDGSVRIDQRRAAPMNVDGSVRPSTGMVDGVTTDTVPPGTEDPTLPQVLIRDPVNIADTLIAAFALTGCDAMHTQCLVTAIENLYAAYVVPPRLTAALWQMLAAEPGAKSLGNSTDRFGEAVTAVAVRGSDPQTVEVLLVSSRTSQLIGTETITLHSDQMDIRIPAVTAFTSIRESSWVPRSGDIPDRATND